MPSKWMTGISRAERRGDSGALSVYPQPCPFLLLQPLLLTASPSSLGFTLSCCAVLLKLPRWPLYLRHWSAHTFVPRKVVFFFWRGGVSAGACFHANHKCIVGKTGADLVSQWHLLNDVRNILTIHTLICFYAPQHFPTRVDISFGGVLS